MKDNFLEQVEADESLKAFSVLLCRYIAKNPSFLLELQQSRPLEVDGEGWKELYEKLQDETLLASFQMNLDESASSYDWSTINKVFEGWGQYGWITDSELGKFGFWDDLPKTQEDADKKVLTAIDDKFLLSLREELEENTNNKEMLDEVFFCFDNHRYIACVSLLTSFIDGVLTSSPTNFTSKNRKTGDGASKKILAELKKDDMLGLPGYFNLELINYNSFISTFFAYANGFENEPSNLNRNYLHHGMSNRRITREDCIKLLIAYRKTLEIAKHDTAEG